MGQLPRRSLTTFLNLLLWLLQQRLVEILVHFLFWVETFACWLIRLLKFCNALHKNPVFSVACESFLNLISIFIHLHVTCRHCPEISICAHYRVNELLYQLFICFCIRLKTKVVVYFIRNLLQVVRLIHWVCGSFQEGFRLQEEGCKRVSAWWRVIIIMLAVAVLISQKRVVSLVVVRWCRVICAHAFNYVTYACLF